MGPQFIVMRISYEGALGLETTGPFQGGPMPGIHGSPGPI
jgi:hypothetical protein